MLRFGPALSRLAPKRTPGTCERKGKASWIACGIAAFACAMSRDAQAGMGEEVHHELSTDKLRWKRRKDPENMHPVVLVACGSFNPPTMMHLRMFELAKDALARKGWEVVGGYVSPVNDSYGKKTLIPSFHRIEMCRLASETSDMIMVDEWEAKQPAYVTTLRVLQRVDKALNHGKGKREPRTRVMFLCGADVVETMGIPGVWADRDIERILSEEHGVVCITREEADIPTMLESTPLLQKLGKHIMVVEEPIPNQISSSRLREEVLQGRSIRYLTPRSVVTYIQQNGLYRASDE